MNRKKNKKETLFLRAYQGVRLQLVTNYNKYLTKILGKY